MAGKVSKRKTEPKPKPKETFLSGIQPYTWHIVIALIAMYLANSYNLVGTLFTTTPEQLKREIMKRAVVKLDEVCNPANECFLITDTPFMHENRIIVRRSLLTKGVEDIAQGIAELITPHELTRANSDPSKWAVNPFPLARYIQMLVSSAFFMESMKFADNAKQDVLMIGLGCGMATKFLAQLDAIKVSVTTVDIDPFMVELAAKWFGNREQKNNKIVIEDGVTYLDREKDNVLKYNHLIIDACHNEKAEVNCPIVEFTEDDVISNMVAILKPGGTMAMNVLCLDRCDEYEEKLLEKYQKHFESCFLLTYIPLRRVLLCAKRPNWTWQHERARFKENIQLVDGQFKFGLYPFFENM